LRAATWRAARSGLLGHLVDPVSRSSVPAHQRVEALLRHARAALEERGDWDTATELWRALQARGTSAERQRRHREKGTEAKDLVASLIEETQQA
jgi:carboxylate-amine ligase